jgi:HNH endonuclease
VKMTKLKQALHHEIKRLLGYRVSDDDKEVLKHFKGLASRVCKPCWELRYCPYGPLVEESPLLPPTRDSAIAHNEYLKDCLRTGKLKDGRRLDPRRRKWFTQEVKRFDPRQYPESIPPVIAETQCTVFGHICPVVFSAEGFTETSQSRRTGRYISFRVKIRVVRRDNYTCQHCGEHLKDNEVEFDHIIPIAKGGSSEEHNIRLTCHDCNADKSDKVVI